MLKFQASASADICYRQKKQTHIQAHKLTKPLLVMEIHVMTLLHYISVDKEEIINSFNKSTYEDIRQLILSTIEFYHFYVKL